MAAARAPQDPQAEEFKGLPRSVVLSAGALIARQGLTKLIGIAGSIVLARVLFPADYGVFALASLLIGGVMMVNDLGLGSSLVQQREEPTRDEMQAIFTFQQVIVLAAVAGIFVLAPVVGAFYHLSQGAVWLTRFMGLYLLATSFRWMPEVLLTRHVRFVKIGIVAVVTAIVYQTVTVGAALAGLGYWALGLGLTIYAVSNALLINWLAPWPIGWRWNWSTVHTHLRFGIPFQGTVLVAALETAAGPVLIGALLGASAVGYATFALSIVSLGLIIPIMILQVGFPAMSRIQQDSLRLAQALQLAIKINCYLICAAYLPLFLFGDGLVRLIFSARWLPALPLLILLLWWGILRSLLTVAATALNAMGRASVNFWLHLAPAVASWLLIVLLVPRHGLLGFGEALLATAIPLPLSLLYLRRIMPLRIGPATIGPFALFAAIYALGLAPRMFVGSEIGGLPLIATVAAILAAYLAGALLIERRSVGRLIGWLRTSASGGRRLAAVEQPV